MKQAITALAAILYLLVGSAVSVYATSQHGNLCTERGSGDEAELFGTVHNFIKTLGKPLCFEFLRWHYKDALVDVPKRQQVTSIDVIKQDIHTDWTSSTRLARCRAFYPDKFRFLKQVGFIRYYTSPRGAYTVELGVDSCFIRG